MIRELLVRFRSLFCTGRSLGRREPVRQIVVALVMSVAAASPLTADDDSWSWSKLNPFGSSETKPAGNQNRRPTAPTRTASKSTSPKSSTPSTWTNLSRGTSQFMGKTKQVLMPWSKPTAKTSTSRVPISRNSNNRKPKQAEEAKSWYEFWKDEPEEKTGPKTVNEFLALPRPE